MTGKYIPIEKGDFFVLPETFSQNGTMGLANVEYSYILPKGKYVAVGKDSKGTYYRGPTHCLYILIGEFSRRYVAEGYVSTPKEVLAKNPYASPEREGGIYVPFDIAKDKPKYFAYQDYRLMTGETDSKIPPSPSDEADESLKSELAPVLKDSQANQALALQVAQNTTGSPANVTTNAVGASLGVAVGHSIGQAGLRNMQGEIQELKDVENPQILEIIKGLKK